ncbi:MAG: 6-phosphogluconolactonase [Deltaproteobacteria bacterium]|nr:6-phosphogluconolactonase [Deltaproteobacteria bacterium]
MEIIKGSDEIIFQKAANLVSRIFASVKNPVIAVCGGRIIQPLAMALRKSGYFFPQATLYLTDERITNFSDALSNEYTIKTQLIEPLENEGIIRDWKLISPRINGNIEEISCPSKINLAILSSGEDGHFASIFPDMNNDFKSDRYIRIINSPKPPPERISMTSETLMKSENILLFFTSESKRNAWNLFKNQETKKTDLPVKVFLSHLHCTVLTDLE